jgi:hypothetical protein
VWTTPLPGSTWNHSQNGGQECPPYNTSHFAECKLLFGQREKSRFLDYAGSSADADDPTSLEMTMEMNIDGRNDGVFLTMFCKAQ